MEHADQFADENNLDDVRLTPGFNISVQVSFHALA